MSRSLDADLDALEAAMSRFAREFKRHSVWEELTGRAGFPIDRSSAAILQILNRCPAARCRLHELVQHLGIEAPPVSRKVQELEQAGMVTRQIDPSDRRAQILRLSPAGQTAANQLQAARRDLVRQAVKAWPAADRQQLIILLERLVTDLTAAVSKSKASL